MATNDAINLNQLKQSVFNMKNYVDTNMNSDNVYKGYKQLMDYSFDIDKDCSPKDGFFDFSITTTDKYVAFYKAIELDREYDFRDKRTFVKREITSKNYDLSNGKGNNVKETNLPYTLLYILSGYNGEDNIYIMTSIYYGKKYYLDESTGKSAYETNNKYISLLYQINLSKYDTTKDHDFSDTIRYIFSLNEFNSNTLIQFPLYKAYNNTIAPVNLDSSAYIGNRSISMSNTSNIPSLSYLTGNNIFPHAYTCSHLAVFGNNNTIDNSYNGFITGSSNVLNPYASGSGISSIVLAGVKNKINEVRQNSTQGFGVIGQDLKVEGSGLYIGAYGTVPYSEVFAICQGTASEDKTLLSVNRTTGAVTSISTPTEDNHLTTKKYVDDKVAGIVNSAPETLDTLNELAQALGNDPNFATTVATQIGNKVDKEEGKSLTTNDLTNDLKANYDAAYAYTQAKHSYNDLSDLPTIPSIDGLATEAYVNGKIVSKYNQLDGVPIEILPYEEKLNSSTNEMVKLTTVNISTLKGNKLYMTVPDCYRLRLTYTQLNGTDISCYTDYNSGNLIIQTGEKTESSIEILVNDRVYTVTFKTDTEDAKVEKSIRYLSNKNTIEYTPIEDYNPATKKYADDIKASIVVPTKTSELTNDSNFLTEHQSLDGYAKTSDIPSIDGLATQEFVSNAISEANDTATDDEVKNAINAILGGDYVE